MQVLATVDFPGGSSEAEAGSRHQPSVLHLRYMQEAYCSFVLWREGRAIMARDQQQL